MADVFLRQASELQRLLVVAPTGSKEIQKGLRVHAAMYDKLVRLIPRWR